MGRKRNDQRGKRYNAPSAKEITIGTTEYGLGAPKENVMFSCTLNVPKLLAKEKGGFE